MDLLTSINAEARRKDFIEYNNDPYRSAVDEIKKVLSRSVDDTKKDVELWEQALSTERWKNPASEAGVELKKQMEMFLEQDIASLKWVEEPTDDEKVRNLVAAKAERLAEWSLFFAKSNLGGERFLSEVSGLTEQEKISLEEAGQLFYSANNLRSHKTD